MTLQSWLTWTINENDATHRHRDARGHISQANNRVRLYAVPAHHTCYLTGCCTPSLGHRLHPKKSLSRSLRSIAMCAICLAICKPTLDDQRCRKRRNAISGQIRLPKKVSARFNRCAPQSAHRGDEVAALDQGRTVAHHRTIHPTPAHLHPCPSSARVPPSPFAASLSLPPDAPSGASPTTAPAPGAPSRRLWP